MKAPFVLDGVRCSNSEKYYHYQYEKAVFFKDMVTAKAIQDTDDPLECSQLGKKIKDYNHKAWMAQAEEVMI